MNDSEKVTFLVEKYQASVNLVEKTLKANAGAKFFLGAVFKQAEEAVKNMKSALLVLKDSKLSDKEKLKKTVPHHAAVEKSLAPLKEKYGAKLDMFADVKAAVDNLNEAGTALKE